jgi:amino acid adenylation domain-containing protein
LFEDQVANHPTKTAVACETESLIFSDLNARANQLACHLRALGIGRESLVGICMDRSLEMVVGILGILKAGGAYLPLDPEYPTDRLAFMIEDARPTLVLTKSNLTKGLPRAFDRQNHSPLPLGEGLGERACNSLGPHPNPPPMGEGKEIELVLLDRDWTAISQHAGTNLIDGPEAGDLAYVIYTSGSTGKPKGVMITHGNLANYLCALNHELQITADDQYLHTASIAFSSSRRQMMLPLSQGATVVIATSEQRKDPLALLEMVKQRGVTVMDAVPSFWRNCTTILSGLSAADRQQLLDNRLRLMLSASEPLLSDIPQIWKTRFGHPARHIHMFGQTETAGIVTLYRIPEDLNGDVYSVPIGNPIANTEIYILDQQQHPCAVGEAGELYVGGAGVGRGYLNRPELTTEKFIPHPFSERASARLYRTGDWARLSEQGQIEFAGRRDQQVKLRGFRIELGEVETALAKHPSIRESVVAARDDATGDKRLIAYFVANQAMPDVTELRRFLGAQLPDYAIPSTFVAMDALPLSANGKVNRLALPEPDDARPQLSVSYTTPRNEIEQRLAEIWSEVLRVNGIGVHDNFFELGGNSLQATQVVSRVRNEFKIEMPLRTLFERPTPGAIAESIATAAATDQKLAIRSLTSAERNGSAPLSLTQQSFWFLDQLEPDSSSYNIRTAIKITGELVVERLQQALEAIVARHEILRSNFVLKEALPIQVISSSRPIDLSITDFSTLPPTEREAEVEKVSRAEGQKPFDLAKGPLLRVKLLRLSADEHLLLLTVHHIVMDGWSIGVLRRELATLYQSFCEGRLSPLPALLIQFADFAVWQRRWLEGQEFAGQLEYWKQELAGAPAALNLPTSYARAASPSGDGAEMSLLLPAKLSDAIKAISRQEDATMFMTLLAAFQTLLFRYSGQDDVVVGTPIAGRTMVETEDLIGPFINTLVVRTDASGNPTFRELLGRVRETSLRAYTHQDMPFEKLVDELRPERSANRTPLFQVMFALQNMPAPEVAVDGLVFAPLRLSSTTAKFDLTLGVTQEPGGLRAAFEYSTDLFARDAIKRMLGHFQTLLETIVADPDQHLTDLLNEELPTPPSFAEPEFAQRAPVVYQAPRTPIEERLTEIWKEVLHTDRIGVNDNFFELGGNSLLATQVVSRIRRAFEIELPLRSFFNSSTIASVAEAIYQIHTAQTEVEELGELLAELHLLSDEEAQRRFANEI